MNSGLGSANMLSAGPTGGESNPCHSVVAVLPAQGRVYSEFKRCQEKAWRNGKHKFALCMSPCAASAPNRVGDKRLPLQDSRSIFSPIIIRLSRRRLRGLLD